MRNAGRKLPLIAVLALVSLLLLAAGCKGFFVNQPNSISVTTGPNGSGSTTFSVAQGGTQQLYATATFNSGSKDVTKSASWQSSSPCATVNAGLVKGAGSTSSLTISATLGGVTGSATGSVTGSGGQSLTISPPGGTFSLNSSQQFTAALNGADVTSSATWSSSNTSIVTFSTTNGLASFVGTGTATISASLVSGSTCASGSATVTVQ
jgi:hypothetical protein